MKKKISIAFCFIVTAFILLSSCKSAEKCAAYGEYKSYKVESR